MTKKVGLDGGFDSTKIVDGEKEVIFENVISEPTESLVNFHKNGIAFDDPPCFVGGIALNYGINKMHAQDDGWVKSDGFYKLYLAGLSEITQEPEMIIATLVVGLPISMYQQEKDAVKQIMQGPHKFTRTGRDPQLVTVQRVIPLPQAIGAGYGEIFDDHGQIANPDLLKGQFGVIDFGSRFTGLAWLVAGRDVPEYTVNIDTVSCWKMVDEIRALLKTRLIRELTPYQGRDVLMSGSIHHQGIILDCKTEIQIAVKKMVDVFANEIRRLWQGSDTLDKIFVTGGGAYLLGKAACKLFPQAQIVKNPIFANALGFRRYALYVGE
jgi:hypothetical protein